MATTIRVKMANGKRVTNRLKGRSGPKRDALICAADFVLQKGQALAIPVHKTEPRRSSGFI
jgi:hypothetical protein